MARRKLIEEDAVCDHIEIARIYAMQSGRVQTAMALAVVLELAASELSPRRRKRANAEKAAALPSAGPDSDPA